MAGRTIEAMGTKWCARRPRRRLLPAGSSSWLGCPCCRAWSTGTHTCVGTLMLTSRCVQSALVRGEMHMRGALRHTGRVAAHSRQRHGHQTRSKPPTGRDDTPHHQSHVHSHASCATGRTHSCLVQFFPCEFANRLRPFGHTTHRRFTPFSCIAIGGIGVHGSPPVVVTKSAWGRARRKVRRGV